AQLKEGAKHGAYPTSTAAARPALTFSGHVPPAAAHPVVERKAIKIRIPIGIIAAAAVVVTLAGYWLTHDSAATAPLQPNSIVVFPFRVIGPDSSLRSMGNGMV